MSKYEQKLLLEQLWIESCIRETFEEEERLINNDRELQEYGQLLNLHAH